MKKNIIFIPTSESNSSSSQCSINSWKKWSHSNNYEFLILEENICNDSSFNKYFIFDLLEESNIEYDQILITNSNSIIHPNAPNIFNLTNNKLNGTFYDSSYDFLLRNIENYSKHMFNDFTFPYWEYLDTEFLIINNEHKNFINKVKNFYLKNTHSIDNIKSTFQLNSDQPVFNFLLHQEKMDFNILPYEWNMQDLLRKEAINSNNPILFTDIGWVYQFNFLSSHKEFLMNNTYKHLFND